LRPKAFELLAYLSANPGRLITKEELTDVLWPGVSVTEDSLLKCLRDVRIALGDAEKQIIQTVPRRGYRFEPSPEESTGIVDVHRRELRWLTFALAGIGVAIAAVFFATANFHRSRIRTIAVLPFKSLASAREPVLEFGIADTLIARLSGARTLTVRPLSSVQKYAAADPLEAARSLDADAVVEGHIHRDGERVRVSVNLLRASDGQSLWANDFDGKFSDLLQLEDAIAAGVGNALGTPVSRARGPRNMQVYSNFMRGRYFHSQRTFEANGKAIAALELVATEDPEFAGGLAELAAARLNRAIMFSDPPESDDNFARAREAAAKALALDPNLASAISTLGGIEDWRDWNFKAAERDLRRAVELDPNLADAHQRLAGLLIATGRLEDGIREARRAVELEPAAVWHQSKLAWLLYESRRYDEALAEARKALELQPDFWAPLNVSRLCYERTGRFEEAFKMEIRLYEARADDAEARAEVPRLRSAYEHGGYRALLAEHLSLTHGPIEAAQIAAQLGDTDRAFTELEKAFRERNGFLIFLRVDPRYDPIRKDPRFEALRARVGIPVARATVTRR